MTIEDETGNANLIVRPNVYDRYRRVARSGVILIARGKVERQGQVVHVMVRRFEDAGRQLTNLCAKSRDFR